MLKRLAELQYNFINICEEYGVDYTTYDLITFEHHGTDIVNPFLDESGMYEVIPRSYYGENYLNSGWVKKSDGYYYVLHKLDENDYELWITEDLKNELSGCSVRGSLQEVLAELLVTI